jgi:hypothetical protein
MSPGRVMLARSIYTVFHKGKGRHTVLSMEMIQIHMVVAFQDVID